MKNQKTTRTVTRRTGSRKVTRPERTAAESQAVAELVRAASARVKAMSPAERRKLVKDYDKQLAKQEPTIEAATSDMLATLLAVGAEFTKLYFPGATMAGFYFSKYPKKGAPEYHAMIPVPVPG